VGSSTKHNLFKYANYLSLMAEEEEKPEEAPKPNEEGEKALEEKAEDLEEQQ